MNEQDLLQATYGKKLYIYGAGRNARRLYDFFVSKGCHIEGFVVSCLMDNPSSLFDRPVIEASSYVSSPDSIVVCSILYLGKGYNDVFETIAASDIRNAIFLSRNSFGQICGHRESQTINDKMQRLEALFGSEGYKLIFSAYNEPNHTILEYADASGIYHWRIQNNLFYDFENMEQIVRGKSIRDEFTEQYGEMLFLGNGVNESWKLNAPSLAVYMVKSHVDKKVVESECPKWLVPIQAGGYFTGKRICELTDDVGDNISAKNVNYSEGTAIYWLWKNAPISRFIGVCQYRRRLDVANSVEEQLESNDIDILTSSPTFLSCDIRTLFANFLPRCDVEIFLSAIKVCAVEYHADAMKFFTSRFYPSCNLFIMKYSVFRKYAEKIFAIVYWVEEYYRKRNIVREDRYMGFLIECFLGIFIMKHKSEYKTACVDMKFYHNAY